MIIEIDDPFTKERTSMPATSQKFKEVEATLPDDIKPIFRRFVEEYEYLTSLHYGQGYVAYKVLADLVLAGWRPSAQAGESSVFTRGPNTSNEQDKS
jgi:hypothetical protein